MQHAHSVESHIQLFLLLHIFYRLSHYYRPQYVYFKKLLLYFYFFINNKKFQIMILHVVIVQKNLFLLIL